MSVPILVNPTGDRALWPEGWSCDPQESSHHCDLCPARWWRHSGGTAEGPNGNGRASWTQLTGRCVMCVMCHVGNKVTCLVLMLSCFYQVIKSVVPAKYLDNKTVYHLQPSGRFVIGGPQVIITFRGKIIKQTRKSSLVFAHLPFLQTGWCWCNRKEDYCRHIRWLGGSRWRSFLWQRFLKGWSLCCLCCSLGGQVSS